MSKVKNVLFKLYISWIAMVAVISISGWIIFSIITLHDTIIKYLALSSVETVTAEKIDSIKDLEDLINWKYALIPDHDIIQSSCLQGSALVFDSNNFKYDASQLEDICDKAASAAKMSKDENVLKFGCGLGMELAARRLNKISEAKTFINLFIEKCISNARKSIGEDLSTRLALLKEKIEYYDFEIYYSDYNKKHNVYLKSLWGDRNSARLSNLFTQLLWLVGGGGVIIASVLVKKWVTWLFR